jgi:hypothetical protein
LHQYQNRISHIEYLILKAVWSSLTSMWLKCLQHWLAKGAESVWEEGNILVGQWRSDSKQNPFLYPTFLWKSMQFLWECVVHMEYSLQHEYCEKNMIKKSAISLSGMTYFRSRSSRCPLTKRKAELLQKYTVLRFLRKGVHMSQESCLPVWTRIMCCMI